MVYKLCDQGEVADKKWKKEQPDDFIVYYEEEADPKICFVQYIWETIIYAMASSTIEWRKDEIHVFPLLDPMDDPVPAESDQQVATSSNGDYAKDTKEIVSVSQHYD